MIQTTLSTGTAAHSAELDDCLRRIAQGDRDALAALYEATKASVYALALSLLKNAPDAGDVLHDCYVSIWNGASGHADVSEQL